MRPFLLNPYSFQSKSTHSGLCFSLLTPEALRGKRAGLGQQPAAAADTDHKIVRKQETLAFAEQDIRQQLALEALRFADGDDAELLDVDDTDGLDVEAEHAAWRLRELGRIKRERDELVAAEKEQEELELLRETKTEAERDEEAFEKVKADRHARFEAAAVNNGQDDNSDRFLQKYYHKGAFYQDEEILKKRDFRGAIEDDYKDKSVLPKALQKRGVEVGLKGRTKYRTMAEEDTSRGADSPWFNRNSKSTSNKGRRDDNSGA